MLVDFICFLLFELVGLVILIVDVIGFLVLDGFYIVCYIVWFVSDSLCWLNFGCSFMVCW